MPRLHHPAYRAAEPPGPPRQSADSRRIIDGGRGNGMTADSGRADPGGTGEDRRAQTALAPAQSRSPQRVGRRHAGGHPPPRQQRQHGRDRRRDRRVQDRPVPLLRRQERPDHRRDDAVRADHADPQHGRGAVVEPRRLRPDPRDHPGVRRHGRRRAGDLPVRDGQQLGEQEQGRRGLRADHRPHARRDAARRMAHGRHGHPRRPAVGVHDRRRRAAGHPLLDVESADDAPTS